MKLVEGPWDFDGDASVAQLHDLDAGRISVVAPLDAGTIAPVAATLLSGLGKSASVAPQAHVVRNEVEWAEIWLEAFRVHTVIVHRIDRVAAAILVELDDLLDWAGCTFYGVADPPWIPLLEERLGYRVEATLGFDDLLGLWPTVSGPDRDPDVVVQDAVPVGERLARIQTPLDRANPAYLAGFVGAAYLPRPERPTAGLVASRIRPILEPMTDPLCFSQAIRGVSLAQLPFGWDIRLDAIRLAQGVPSPAISECDGLTFRSFWIFRDPLQGAAWVLSRLPIAVSEILSIAVCDVADDGSMVAVAGEWFDLPVDAQPLLRAQLIARARADATLTDPLILRPGGRPTTPEWLVGLLRATGAEANVRAADRQLYLRSYGDERWLEDRGVSIKWIRREDRPGGWPDDDRLALEAELVREGLASPAECGCSCESAHLSPLPGQPEWPPQRLHAVNPPDHPWRSDWVWSKSKRA